MRLRVIALGGALTVLLSATAVAFSPEGSAATPTPATPLTLAKAPNPTATPIPAFAYVQRGDGTAISIDVGTLQRSQRAIIAGSTPKRTPPPIDPPAYSACIAQLAREHRERGRRRKACRSFDLRTREQAARSLLDQEWLIAELDRRRIVFTEHRVARALADVIADAFASRADYRRWKARTGLIDADLRRYAITQLAQDAIIRQLLAPLENAGFTDVEKAERAQVIVDAFKDEFYTRSFAATTCAAPYDTLRACTVARQLAN